MPLDCLHSSVAICVTLGRYVPYLGFYVSLTILHLLGKLGMFVKHVVNHNYAGTYSTVTCSGV